MLPLLELLEPYLPTLLPLLKRRDTYYVLVIAALALLLWSKNTSLKSDEVALSYRPRVESHVKTSLRTVVIQGPERIVEKVVKGDVVERVIYKDVATTTTEAASETDSIVAPSCAPEQPAPWRYAGIIADPFSATKIVGARGSVTLWKNYEVGLGFRLSPHVEGQADFGIRF